jgi:hypothetical protein
MMTWNYRVFEEPNGDYIVREVFYTEDGAIFSCTESAVEPFGRSLEELAENIEWFKEALALPVLTLADVPENSPIEKEPNQSLTLSHEQLLAELNLEEPRAS